VFADSLPREDSTVSSPMVLFIHGMWADGACWARYRRVFERQGFETHAPTLLFHETPQDMVGLRRTGIMDYVEQAVSVVRSLREPPIVVGHSMGALVAQKLAEQDLVRGLALLASVAPAGIPCLTPTAFISISGNLVDILQAKPFIMPPWNARYGLTNTLSRREQDVVQQSLLYESGLALREIVLGAIPVDERRVRCPVMVGVGDEDRATPPSVARGIARKYHAELHRYDGRCHFIAGARDILEDVLLWCQKVGATA